MIVSSMGLQFWGAALVSALLLSLVVITPWLRRRPPQAGRSTSVGISLMDLNVSVFRERLRELEADLQQGRLTHADYQGLKTDLERQLLAALEAQRGTTQAQESDLPNMAAPVVLGKRPPLRVIGLVFLWLPVLAFALYGMQIGGAESHTGSVSNKATDYNALWAYWLAEDQYANVAEQLMSGQVSAPPPDALQHGMAFMQVLQRNAYVHPMDADRWVVLAEGYHAAEMDREAEAALAHAHRLAPDQIAISMRYVQMRFVRQAGKIDETSRALLQQVLLREPQHEGALMLLALASYRDQQYDAAISWLLKAKAARLARSPGDASPELIARLDQTIAQAQHAKQAQQAATSSGLIAKSRGERVLNTHHSLSITVQLAASLHAKIKPSDTLFVYARARAGASMPFAVQKFPASVLSARANQQHALHVMLSDADHMLPEFTLSSAYARGTPLVVAARISGHGDPSAQSGDLESLPRAVIHSATGRNDYLLHIDRIRP